MAKHFAALIAALALAACATAKPAADAAAQVSGIGADALKGRLAD